MRKLKRKTLVWSFCLLIGAIASMVYAQEDSLKGEGTSLDSLGHTLRIPDIIIYGEDIERQEGGTKLKGGEVGVNYPQPKAVKPMAAIKLQRSLPPLWESKPLFNLLYAGYGRFHHFRFCGWRSQAVEPFHYQLQGAYESSHGHLPGADYSRGRIGGWGGYSFTDLFDLTSNLSYSQEEFGLYGSLNPPLRRRELQKVDFNLGLKRGGKYHQWEMGLGYQEMRVKDKGGRVSTSTGREGIWRWKLRGKAKYRKVALLSDFQVRSFKLKRRENCEEVRVEGEGPLTKGIHLGGGLKVQFLQMKERWKFSPLFHINYNPGEGRGFFFHLTGGYIPHTLQESFSQNRYFRFPQKEFWEDRVIKLSLGMEYEVRKGLFFKDVLVHQQIRDYLFWAGDSSGLFRFKTFPEVRTIENNLMLRFFPYEKLDIELTLLIKDADLTKGSSLSIKHVPYWEKSSLQLGLDLSLGWGINCWLEGQYHGRRYTSLASNERINPFYLINIKLNKKLNDHFKVIFEGNNLTNSQYEIWGGYKEPGMNCLLGLSYKW